MVLGFPCNQFGEQEPGSAGEIGSFCQKNYGVSFPMFDKIDVNGDAAHPLYRWLKKSAPGLLGSERIKWNFTKFLLDRNGRVVERYAPVTKPEDLAKDIETLLWPPCVSVRSSASRRDRRGCALRAGRRGRDERHEGGTALGSGSWDRRARLP